MDDLFIRYLQHLSKEYPYILLNVDDSSTTISLGYEYCCQSKRDLSHQEFIPFEKYPIPVDLQKIQTYPLFDYTIKKANNKILLETKRKLEIPESAPYFSFLWSNELSNYLASHQRVVLDVSTDYDPCDGNDAIASVILNSTPAYHSCRNYPFVASGMTKIGKCFKIRKEQIIFLPKEKNLDVFILREDKHSVLYEIINKTL